MAIVDENGIELDEDGNKKVSLNAYSLKRKDIENMVSSYSKNFFDAEKKLCRVADGISYSDGVDALAAALKLIDGGSVMDFYRSSSWLSEKSSRQKFLDKKDGSQSYDDKMLVVEFFALLQLTTEFRSEFSKLMTMCLSDSLYYSFCAIRYEAQLREMVTDEGMNDIIEAFREYGPYFDSFYGSTISVENASRANVIEEAKRAMSSEIKLYPHLAKFLVSADKLSSYEANRLHILDRYTKNFSVFSSSKDVIKESLNLCKILNNKRLVYETPKELEWLMIGYGMILDRLEGIFEKALEIIDDFNNEEKTVPYSVLHYNVVVKNTVNRYSLGTVGDPLKDGTEYHTYFEAMTTWLKKLANQIAE